MRYASNALTVASFFAALITGLLWFATFAERGDARIPLWTGRGRYYSEEVLIWIDHASFRLCYRRPIEQELTQEQWTSSAHSRARLHRQYSFLGFVYLRGRVAMFGAGAHGPGIKWADDWVIVGVPVPLAIALLLAPPLVRWPRQWRRHTRRQLGLCVRCGYDLRASRDVCPECGGTVPTQAVGPTTC